MLNKREIQEKKKGIFLLRNPSLYSKHYLLSINIIKAENFPDNGSGGLITTYWSARVMGNTMITGSIKDNLSPGFNTKLNFPIILPILNDKIIIKIWMVTGATSTELLANVPEVPEATDFFNISKLQGNDGRMALRWFNLYGTKPKDRSMFFTPSTAYYLEGPSYMGRVLLSMSINPYEKPKLGKGSSSVSKEPTTAYYTLYWGKIMNSCYFIFYSL